MNVIAANQTSPNAHTVESLLERLALKGQKKIWESFPETITVKGTVDSVRNWQGKLTYITLEGSGLHMTLKCPFGMRPDLGTHIVFQGLVTLKPHRFNMSGLDVQVVGEPVGFWAPKPFEKGLETIEKGARLLLSNFLATAPLEKLLILGTNTALRDVEACFSTGSDQTNLTTETIRVHERDALLEDINRALEKHTPTAIAIVRGGDDATMNIWDDSKLVHQIVNFNLPFYLALGHSHRVTLADKYADEVFHTPSNFGAMLSQQYMIIVKQKKLENYCSTLNEKIETADRKLSHIKSLAIKTNAVWFLLSLIAALYIFYA